jgi:hypothetical protein
VLACLPGQVRGRNCDLEGAVGDGDDSGAERYAVCEVRSGL